MLKALLFMASITWFAGPPERVTVYFDEQPAAEMYAEMAQTAACESTDPSFENPVHVELQLWQEDQTGNTLYSTIIKGCERT